MNVLSCMQERSFLFLPIFTAFTCVVSLSLACHRCSSAKPDSVGFTPKGATALPYNLEHPDWSVTLNNSTLQEISGLCWLPNGLLGAVADERGEFFVLDPNQQGAIQTQVLFKDKGDFEGVEVVGDTLFCIKSNGDLYQITNWMKGATPTIQEYELDLKAHDIEGLGYDPKRRCLLVAGKEDPESSAERLVWAFDLRSSTLIPEPIYRVNPANVDALVEKNDDDKARFFSTSGIAMHPITGDIYLISTALKRLAVLDGATGQPKAAVRLDRDVLGQPEGICFDPTGNLYISSEAKKQPAMIAKFNYRKP